MRLIDLQCVSSKPPKPERKCAAGRTVPNRYETFRCQACGRGVKRKSRQQRFCSDRCRNYAHRNAPSQINGRTAIKNASGHPDSRAVTNPHFLSSKNNELRGPKSGAKHPAKRAWRLSLAQCRRCRPRAVAPDCQSRDRGHPMTGNVFQKWQPAYAEASDCDVHMMRSRIVLVFS